jgi:leucyl/phenylalanyl-tRNA---protein transferase
MAVISPEFMVEAYSQGYFPMGKEGSDQEVEWYSARKRGIFPLDSFHVPKRVLRTIRSNGYSPAVNGDFEGVIQGCANRESTWINSTIHDTFLLLHKIGLAHSFEVWKQGELCGGLYGISLGGAFFAESVYQSKPECMKIALHFCHQALLRHKYVLWDVQFQNPFLEQFGCVEISPAKYRKLLEAALNVVAIPLLDESDTQR